MSEQAALPEEAKPRSRAKQLNKDMHSVDAFSTGHGLELPLQQATVRQFQAYVDRGAGEADSASICRLYEKE